MLSRVSSDILTSDEADGGGIFIVLSSAAGVAVFVVIGCTKEEVLGVVVAVAPSSLTADAAFAAALVLPRVVLPGEGGILLLLRVLRVDVAAAGDEEAVRVDPTEEEDFMVSGFLAMVQALG